MPRSQISEKQLAANRSNALRSTGPRTAEGKARSSQNARKHGLAVASLAVARPEDLEELARLRADLTAVYCPVNSQELFALEHVAQAQQAILRAARLESGLFAACQNQSRRGRRQALGEGFHYMAQQSNAWTLFLRYQAQAERNYRRAIEEFERLKALRTELPNDPISVPQPEQKEQSSSPERSLVPAPAQFAPDEVTAAGVSTFGQGFGSSLRGSMSARLAAS